MSRLIINCELMRRGELLKERQSLDGTDLDLRVKQNEGFQEK